MGQRLARTSITRQVGVFWPPPTVRWWTLWTCEWPVTRSGVRIHVWDGWFILDSVICLAGKVCFCLYVQLYELWINDRNSQRLAFFVFDFKSAFLAYFKILACVFFFPLSMFRPRVRFSRIPHCRRMWWAAVSVHFLHMSSVHCPFSLLLLVMFSVTLTACRTMSLLMLRALDYVSEVYKTAFFIIVWD